MASRLHVVTIYLTSGILSVFVLFILFFLIYRWKSKKLSGSKLYPSIVLTSHDSPTLKEKRLWSPPDKSTQIRQGTKSTSKAERSQKVRSYWFPKRDLKPFLPPIKGEYQQPKLPKQSGDIVKGRLKFSLGYDYNMELKKSILTVHLHHGRDYTLDPDAMPMDTFVKTRLLPSKRQTFTSKLQRRTMNPNYNECYQFDIEYSELNSQVLCFEMFRYDCVSRHEIFGEVIVPFRDIGSDGCNIIKEVSMSMNIVDYTDNERRMSVNNDAIIEDSKKEEGEDINDDGEVWW